MSPLRPPLACIGAGRLARTLLPLLAASGYPILAVSSRRIAAARAACRAIPGTRPTTDPVLASRRAAILLLAVPDRVVAPLALSLSTAADLSWSGKTVLHHAGALGPAPLRPLARAGASVGVLHPLQTLGERRLSREALAGSRARVEGEPRARAVASRLARDLGLVPLILRPSPTASDRAAYHAAASLVSNDLVALLSYGVEILESIGLSGRAAIAALVPLARGTLRQVEAGGPERALTGPVVRGDVETLRAQLAALNRRSRSAAQLHRLLSARLLALSRGAPPGEQRDRLQALLRGGRRGGRTV